MSQNIMPESTCPAEQQFETLVAELVVAKDLLIAEAIYSKSPERIKSALILLLESHKSLIHSLDDAYKKLHDARMGFSS